MKSQREQSRAVARTVATLPLRERRPEGLPPLVPVSDFVAVVVDAGPQNQADFANHRYWVSAARMTNQSSDPEQAITWDEFATTDSQYIIVKADNVAESVEQSHSVPVGTPVLVRACPDLAGTMRYWFSSGSGGSVFTVEIATVDSGGGFPYAYTARRWSNGVASGDPLPLLNRAESVHHAPIIESYAGLATFAIVSAWWNADQERLECNTFGDFAAVDEC